MVASLRLVKERKVQFIIKNFHIRKREATNLLKPQADTDQLCSLFHQDPALTGPVPAQVADTHLTHPLLPQCREINCAQKASARGTFDIYFRTILLWLKASLPVLPRASLTLRGWPPTSPLSPKDKPKECVLPSFATPKVRLASDKKLLATFGRLDFSTSLMAAENTC